MAANVSLVIFEGGLISGHLEEQMRQVRQGIVLDQIAKAHSAGIGRIVLCTPYQDLAERARLCGAAVELVQDAGEGSFHFGQLLREIVQSKGLDRVLYMGGAAAPLLSCQELQYLAEIIQQNDGVVIANNYYSADIVGFAPAQALEEITLPVIDNTLALALVHEAGLRLVPLSRTLGLNFDVDTPSDLLVLAVHPDIGQYTKQAVSKLEFDFSRHDAIKDLVNNPNGELVMFGRIGSSFFEYLDAQTRCRVRLFSEERGMKALGRDGREEVVSLVGRLLEELGYIGFFSFLSEICGGAVLDTRVLFEHMHWKLSQAERFASDVGAVNLIEHPGLRAFTSAAFSASVPVLLGGHSLVTGGMWALIDASMRER